MGASASTNQQTIVNNTVNEAYNSCPTVGTMNATTISGLKFLPPPDCNPPSSFDISQVATVKSECLISSLQKGAANISSKLDSQSKAGLGISVSTNINDVITSISNITKNTCAGVSTNNKADLTNLTVRACQFKIAQDASANAYCQINSAQDLISNIATKASSQAQGGSIWGNLFGGGFGGILVGIIVIVVICLFIGLGIYLFRKSSQNKNTSDLLSPSMLEKAALLGGFGDDMSDFLASVKNSNMYKFIVILIMIVVILILMKTLNMPNPINH